MSNPFMVNVSGGKYYADHYEKVKKGQKLILKKDPKNKHDRDAVKVCLPTGEQVGWVANSDYTIKRACLSASQVQPLFKKIQEAYVIHKNGQTCKLACNYTNRDFIQRLNKSVLEVSIW